MLFNELGLSAELLRAVEEQGYEKPTPIQREAIPTFSKATIFSPAPRRARARPLASRCRCCRSLETLRQGHGAYAR